MSIEPACMALRYMGHQILSWRTILKTCWSPIRVFYLQYLMNVFKFWSYRRNEMCPHFLLIEKLYLQQGLGPKQTATVCGNIMLFFSRPDHKVHSICTVTPGKEKSALGTKCLFSETKLFFTRLLAFYVESVRTNLISQRVPQSYSVWFMNVLIG